MRPTIRFHLRGIARHVKGLAKNLLGLHKPITEEELATSTAAWHQPLPSDHPVNSCKCPCGTDAPADHHRIGCHWAESMCEGCGGNGYCGKCGGDGIDPAAPPPLSDDAIEVP